MEGFLYLYIFMLAAFTGYEVISRVPVILHTPLMSGSNFIHGVVLVGAMVALGAADPEDPLQLAIGFFAVLLGAANAAGGYVVTERMLGMFKSKKGGA
jgi:NAD(P) transhydrogenase subunit alpha